MMGSIQGGGKPHPYILATRGHKSDEPIVADGTADFLSEDEPMEVVDVVGAREEGTNCFDDGIKVERGR